MREKVEPTKRKPLTPKQRAQIFLDQDGFCGCGCGVKMDHAREGTIDEHINPLGLTGTNDRENRRLYRLPCAKLKTKDDIRRIAKAKRIIRKSDPETRKPPTLKGRGFDKTLRKKFNGKVERRR